MTDDADTDGATQRLLDAAMVDVARDLADALREYARERRPDQKLVVAELQTQLCATRRAELDAQ